MYRHQQILKAVLATICYADIFRYPLTRDEISAFFISGISNFKSFQSSLDSKSIEGFKISNKFQLEMENSLTLLIKKGYITSQNKYFCLKGREKIFKIRNSREKISEEKINKAKKVSNILKYIPTVQLIGISGSLAMSNASINDDIDLFIITKSKTIWISRLIILIFLQLIGVKRKRFIKNAKDRICVNMFLAESNLSLPRIKRNLYTAHELTQMKTIFSRNNTYHNFLIKNTWIKKYLPNTKYEKTNITSNSSLYQVLINLALPLEIFAKKLQLSYMKKYRTTELITNSLLAFHPRDQQTYVFSEFQNRLKKYEI